jgi:hypothetical protein
VDKPRLWDLAAGVELRDLGEFQGGISNAGFTPDGRRILVADATGTGHLMDAATGREIRRRAPGERADGLGAEPGRPPAGHRA